MRITKSGIYEDVVAIKELVIANGVNASLPNLTSIGENVDVQPNATLNAPSLTSIGGNVHVYQYGTLTAPNLTSIGGAVSVAMKATLDAPNLTSIGGNAEVYSHGVLDAPNLTSMCRNAHVYRNGTLTRSDTNIPYDPAMLERSFNSSGYTFLDRILAKIVHRRGNVMKILIVGQTEPSYVVTNGTFNAHRQTLREAKEALEFKINAEKIKHAPIYPDTKITIEYYHTITGACKTGIAHWMDQVFDAKERAKIERSGIKAAKLLPILIATNAYGQDGFVALYTEASE